MLLFYEDPIQIGDPKTRQFDDIEKNYHVACKLQVVTYITYSPLPKTYKL